MALRATEYGFERLYTTEEFEQLPEFGDRYDLIDGRLVKRPMASGEHSLIADNIRDAFKFFNRAQPKSIGVMLQEASVKLGSHSSPTPDVSFWKAERNAVADTKAMPKPDLAVEVHSPSDLKSKTTLASAMVKVEKLLDAGVPIVWAVYPNKRVVEVYHASKGYQAGPVQTLTINDTLDGEDVIPGFKLPVADLFLPLQ
jgi:Uma2 family endonuclease